MGRCRRLDRLWILTLLSICVLKSRSLWRHSSLNKIDRCITARRRRRSGFIPYRGTGWAAGRFPPNQGPAPYNGPQQYYGGNQHPPPQAAAPPYSPSHQGYYGNTGSNQGYFGGQQQTGVELQPPQNTFQPQRGGDAVYEPPSGPPPKR